ncbi:dnaJ homolog subfamily C member 17 isoform X1 [Salmo salar]|uniref:DnaJ homolog subfamily C member 17 n=1 Tax=Salmo salar TaxID=8030 RepID=A0A1S3P350_SALSA|nr:dnaJ homolog subfamily C member 17-like isoform X1 [Salmo salar]|eukprot:XP_014022063.1 PREDICTED: dnaJ homolog subfamily C member 17-like isoform X1 [Salmo salar]
MTGNKAKDLLQMDLYGLLGIDGTATAKEIKKAYRQKALTCHPDKNPDNPKAADLFHQLSQALEVLTDSAARAAYDKICAAKKQAEARNNKLDAKRKKIKLDLEARERQAEAHSAEQFQNTRTLEEEIARLREEGSRQLQEEQRLIKEQIQREREAQLHHSGTADYTATDAALGRHSKSNVTPKLKLKWKCKKEDDTNGGYSQDFIFCLLSKYGDVLNVLISRKKRGSAVVEFETVKAAELAYKNESGLTANPLKISWLEGQPEVITPVVSQVQQTSGQYFPPKQCDLLRSHRSSSADTCFFNLHQSSPSTAGSPGTHTPDFTLCTTLFNKSICLHWSGTCCCTWAPKSPQAHGGP